METHAARGPQAAQAPFEVVIVDMESRGDGRYVRRVYRRVMHPRRIGVGFAYLLAASACVAVAALANFRVGVSLLGVVVGVFSLLWRAVEPRIARGKLLSEDEVILPAARKRFSPEAPAA